MFDIYFYELPSGTKPVEEFLNSLDIKMRIKATDSIRILSEYGSALRPPYSKYVGNGIFELRIKFSTDISRIFYFFCVNNKIILTNGFIKKTQKTPSGELEKAKKYKLDFERRFSNG